MKSYTVQQGDTLYAIARREYGDGDLYPVIARQNQLPNPNLIVVGQELLIPYVTYRHLFTAAEDSGEARRWITKHFYGSEDTKLQLVWEIASGVAQQPIYQGAWLSIPDLANAGHHTVVADESLAGLAGRWYWDDSLRGVVAYANGLEINDELTPGQVLIRPGLNLRRNIAGFTLEELCRENYGDGALDTWVPVVEAANHINRADKLFAGQIVHFPS